MAQQTAVNWLLGFIEPSLTSEQKHFFSKVIEQAKAMEKKQSHDYAVFCVICDRDKMKLLDFNDYMKIYTNGL
jgi:hypothetical protein